MADLNSAVSKVLSQKIYDANSNNREQDNLTSPSLSENSSSQNMPISKTLILVKAEGVLLQLNCSFFTYSSPPQKSDHHGPAH